MNEREMEYICSGAEKQDILEVYSPSTGTYTCLFTFHGAKKRTGFFYALFIQFTLDVG